MRNRKFVVVSFLLPGILVAIAGCEPAAPAPVTTTAAASASAVDPGNASGNKLVTVTSQNLYLGADLMPVILAPTAAEFVAATTQVWATVQANDRGDSAEDVLARLDGIADEIASATPDLVGLQEAYTWEVAAPGTSDFVTVYDYLATLRAKLAERGLDYAPVAELPLFRFAAPIATGHMIRMTDHQVILARSGVHVSNPQADVFGPEDCASDPACFLLLKVTVLGQTVAIPRGWASVDVKLEGETFRFVSAHLDGYHPGVRTLQAMELAGTLAEVPGRVVLVGDLNFHPDAEPHALFLSGGFVDVWTALHEEPVAPGDEGFTGGLPDLLWTDGMVNERLDYVLVRGAIRPVAASVLGDREADRVPAGDVRLWPSDHAAIAATLRLVDPQFVPAPAP